MITTFGWSPALQRQFEPYAAGGLVPARVTAQHRGLWRVVADAGETEARLAGRFAHEAAEGGYPVVGDWVAALAEGCRFRDCAHKAEPGCAVRAALQDGRLDEDRWKSFQKLKRELAFEARRQDPELREAERKRWIAVHKSARQHMKDKRRFE